MIRLLWLALVVVGQVGCSASDASMAKPPVRRVRTAAVTPAPKQLPHRFYGTTRSQHQANLSIPSGGRLVSRPVRVGDTVTQGQLIASLDTQPLNNALTSAKATVAELQARLGQARRDVVRVETLRRQDGSTEQALERAEVQVKSLEAQLAAAKAARDEQARLLNEAVLTAPFAGTITDIYLEPGETAGPGAPIATLTGVDVIEVEVGVPERLIPTLHVGETARIDLPALGVTELPATIVRVGQAAKGPGTLFSVVVSTQSTEWLTTGLTAEVVLYTPLSEQRTVPVRAVVDPTGLDPSVFRVTEDTAQRVPVTPGVLIGNRVVIQGDLAVDDPIIVDGLVGLLPGEPVEVANP